jgi:hypothetical protein
MRVPLSAFGASVKSNGVGPTAGSAIANALYSIVPGVDGCGLSAYSAVWLGATLGLLIQLTIHSRTVRLYKQLVEIQFLLLTKQISQDHARRVRDELLNRYFLNETTQDSECDEGTPDESPSKEAGEGTEDQNRDV